MVNYCAIRSSRFDFPNEDFVCREPFLVKARCDESDGTKGNREEEDD
jgi:hypothetical protein